MPALRSHLSAAMIVAVALCPAFAGQTASAQRAYAIAYRIAMPDPSSHLFEVQIDVGRLSGDSLALQMPVWSPGRYAPMFFAKNVQQFAARTTDGRPLTWTRTIGSRWVVSTKGVGGVTVTYRVFANSEMSGTFSVLDASHANWNGPSLFMYVESHKPDPVTLHVTPPPGWHVINGDADANDKVDYSFENYDRLVDTPTEVSPAFTVDSFSVDGVLYRAMMHHNGTPPAGARARFVSDVRKLVTYENSVFGPPPLRMYTFLFHAGFPGGDGMEHLFSTQIQNARPWVESDPLLSGISSAAHEYFHVWNVKRVRPMLLGPFDYTGERYQPSLWVAEGWTQYYGQVALHRAGITDENEMLGAAAAVVQENLTAPGRHEVSPRMASLEAPFWDGAPDYQPVNGERIWLDYYTQGAGRALYLDLFIRERTNNAKALDDAFDNLRKRSWSQPNASYYLQGRGYTEDDVEKAVSEAAGVDMHDWFERHVGGTEDVDFESVLVAAGLRLNRDVQRWSIETVRDAAPAQVRIRQGWLSGKKG